MMNIDLELYKVFYTVAKHNHMTRASEELHISQPAISQSIKKLEEQLGGILFLIYGNEVLSLVGGSYSKFMEFQSAYTVHFAGMKYAIENGYDRYNFYGITGDFREENPLFGLYSFKRDFGGQVVELIGEFDLIISKPLYYLYKVSYALYRTLKNIKNNIKKK